MACFLQGLTLPPDPQGRKYISSTHRRLIVWARALDRERHAKQDKHRSLAHGAHAHGSTCAEALRGVVGTRLIQHLRRRTINVPSGLHGSSGWVSACTL